MTGYEYGDFPERITELLFVPDRIEPADIIFVPGNAWPHMAERAAALYREGLAPRILPSGGRSQGAAAFPGAAAKRELYPGPYPSEWAFLSDVLQKNGVPEQAILREDKASYTWENAKYSLEVVQSTGLEIKKAIVCCKSTHMRRALLYYQKAFPEAALFPCSCYPENITKENWHQSRESIDAVMGELMRIVWQFSVLMKPQ